MHHVSALLAGIGVTELLVLAIVVLVVVLVPVLVVIVLLSRSRGTGMPPQPQAPWNNAGNPAGPQPGPRDETERT
jgi:Mn2+/Fe2+ NRAMP family transporter